MKINQNKESNIRSYNIGSGMRMKNTGGEERIMKI